MLCPRCAVALHPAATLGDLGAHTCPECGGVFANRAVIAALATGTVAPSPHPDIHPHKVDTSGYIKCPVCDEMMSRVNFGRRSGVIVDICVDHGTWFDADEIDRAATFIAQGGLTGGKEGALPPEKSLSLEAQHKLGELKAQMVGDRYDQMERIERTTWFTRFGMRLIFDWFL